MFINNGYSTTHEALYNSSEVNMTVGQQGTVSTIYREQCISHNSLQKSELSRWLALSQFNHIHEEILKIKSNWPHKLQSHLQPQMFFHSSWICSLSMLCQCHHNHKKISLHLCRKYNISLATQTRPSDNEMSLHSYQVQTYV